MASVVLDVLNASKDFVVLSRCVRVCREWRLFVSDTLGLGPENSLQMQYCALANAFTDALPETMRIMYEKNICTPGLSPLQADLMIREAVQHVVQGLEALLHSKPAVEACITALMHILTKLYVLHIHTGAAARPTTWTLLRVLCAYPADAVQGLNVMCLILRYITVMRDMRPVVRIMDQRDTVVLSAAQLPRAIAVIDAYLATWPSTAVIRPELVAHCAQVRLWIVRGSLLNSEAYVESMVLTL